jgi:hypothetical protein
MSAGHQLVLRRCDFTPFSSEYELKMTGPLGENPETRRSDGVAVLLKASERMDYVKIKR